MPWPIGAVPRFRGPREAFPSSAPPLRMPLTHTSGTQLKRRLRSLRWDQKVGRDGDPWAGWSLGPPLGRWDSGVGVGSTGEGAMYLERERKALLFLGLGRAHCKKGTLGPCDTLVVRG